MELISATIITRNEEQNLERCLNALRDVADEIVVVDSYSNDRTLEICKKYGCKIVQREFNGFGSQRQYAAGLTTHAYIISIDADEVIDEQLRQSIIDLKKRGFDHRVYKLKINNYFCGKVLHHCGFQPFEQVRLFNKRYAHWDLRDVADSLSYSNSISPAPISGSIQHYRCSTIEEHISKENRLAALRAKIIANDLHSMWSLTPTIKALKEYIYCQLHDLAFMDGKVGMTIAARKARTTYESYRMARHIIKESAS